MTGSDPSPHNALLRAASLTLATLAVLVALTGVVARASVLAWAVALMALIIFEASHHLKH